MPLVPTIGTVVTLGSDVPQDTFKDWGQAVEDALDSQAASIAATDAELDALSPVSYASDQALNAAEQLRARRNIGLGASSEEAAIALGIGVGRVTLNTVGRVYILNPSDTFPIVHYGLLGAAGTATLDVAALQLNQSVLIINESVTDGIIRADCSVLSHFRGAGISPTDVTKTTFDVPPNSRALITRTGGNRFHVTAPVRDAYWTTSGSAIYRRLVDGTYEVIYTRTTTLSGSSESTANTVPAFLDVSSARTISVAYGVKSDGSAPPDLVPQVTKLGTPHGLTANQFAIRNPNAAAITHPIIVTLQNVLRP